MTTNEDRSRTAALQAALEALPAQQRQVFLAIRHENVGYGELARRLGTTTDAVELAFAQALVALVKAADGAA